MAMMKISTAIQAIQEAMMSLPIGSDLHKAANKAVADLSKHFQGPSTPPGGGAQQTMLQDQLRALAQRALMQRVSQNSGGAPTNQPSLPQPGA